MHLIDLYKSFETHEVRYLLCGGLAINLYGIPRATADMDILLDYEEANLLRFMESIKAFGFQASIPISILELKDPARRKELISQRNLIAFSFFSTTFLMVTLDVLVDVPFDFQELWEARESRATKLTRIELISVPHLAALKTVANRQQDQLDIAALRQLYPDKF